MRVGLLGCLLLCGCSLVRSPLLDDELDGGPELDAPLDAPVITDRDAPLDAPVIVEPDVPAPFDAGSDVPIDVGTDAPARLTCDELFMAAIPGYRDCGGTDRDACRFYADPSPSTTCGELCGRVAGATCVGSEADDDTFCGSTEDLGCDQVQEDTICICRRP